MNLEIVGVRDAGNLEAERVVLRVNQNCDVGDFLIRDGTYPANGASARLLQEYQFPRKRVLKGQIVRLYTKAGIDGEQLPAPEKGSQFVTPHYHDFHWGLTDCVWNVAGDTAYLLRIAGVQAFDVKPGASSP